MLKSVLAILAVVIGSLFFVQGTLADGGRAGVQVRLEARLRSGGVEAKVAYTEESASAAGRKAQAEIKRAAPNTTFAVFHKGVQIATMTTDGLGFGRVEVRGAQVPRMLAGDPVGVGAMTGPLVAR